MKTVLYLTDLYFEAKGRKYYQEDLFLTSQLKRHFNILIGHPHQAISFLDSADMVVFRNTGPVLGYQDYFNHFLEAVKTMGIPTFNSFDGKADIRGKQYLLDLMDLNYPVIPTVSDISGLDRLGNTDKYIVKIKNGADSIGMEILSRSELLADNPKGKLIQPFLPLDYEVSFYYLNHEFQYALYAPDRQKRWELTEYFPTEADILFADKFIRWNDIKTGITRVDAGRTSNGELLLVELEDLNPFLSIGLLAEEKQQRFINRWVDILKTLS
ncbi:hypothetical protein QF042_001992 [Pedobacter sp. W3I1]|uniref:hypothetical protein n=1 Tax=Pedobacter sp. W3I1 TaxID=3042291 RepID=UPI0027832597|nr:hypothetical protein [Pedobacter sp. W3I1]MDQ0638427.1 hypothetical protein [Pedobacter sp. W3I1]